MNSRKTPSSQAAKEALEECGGQPTVGFLFLSASWLPQINEVLDLVRLHGRIPLLVGSLGAGLIGAKQGAEGVAGMSLLLLSLPETKLTPVLISNEQIEESTGPAYWQMESGMVPTTSIPGSCSPIPMRRILRVG